MSKVARISAWTRQQTRPLRSGGVGAWRSRWQGVLSCTCTSKGCMHWRERKKKLVMKHGFPRALIILLREPITNINLMRIIHHTEHSVIRRCWHDRPMPWHSIGPVIKNNAQCSNVHLVHRVGERHVQRRRAGSASYTSKASRLHGQRPRADLSVPRVNIATNSLFLDFVSISAGLF